MTRTRTHTNQQQSRINRYVILLLLGITGTFFWGLTVVSTSAGIVHQVKSIEQENRDLSLALTQAESQYHQETQMNYSEEAQYENMVSYSVRDENVRYAQVGGSVYSVLSRNDL